MEEKLSIIIPAYNEEKRIGNTLTSYVDFFRNKGINFEIIVVLNNCSDNTFSVVENLKISRKEIVILNYKRGGKGFAIKEGFKNALRKNSSLIGFVDADMATSPEEFYKLFKSIKGFDGAIASRGLKESIVETSFKRKLTNKGFNFFVRTILLLPYKDTQCGAKIFRKKPLEDVLKIMALTEWAFDIDLLYNLKSRGYVIKEVSTVWKDIEGSKIDLIRVPIQMFLSIIRLRIFYSPFKKLIKLYDNLPEGLKIHKK